MRFRSLLVLAALFCGVFFGVEAIGQASAVGSAASSPAIGAATTRAADWLPLLRALVWPAFLGGLALWLRTDIRRVVGAVAVRIERGDAFEAGASGIKLSAVPKALAVKSETEGAIRPAPAPEEGSFPHSIYLLHSANRDARLDRNDHDYYRLRLWLDADVPGLLKAVASVTYHLHPTFENPVRMVHSPDGGFAMTTRAWGQFMAYARVEMIDKASPPLLIERYIDF